MKSFKRYFSDKNYRVSFFSGLGILTASLFTQFLATGYASRSVSGSVTDIILSNTRVYDVDTIFIYGTVVLVFFVLYVCLSKPNYLPFLAKSIAVFTFIRSAFITLTHIDIFPLHATISSAFFQGTVFRGIFTGNGLFFSGHTGVPFLLALIFWNNKKLRYTFLGFSLLFAVVVLLGHIHYSIDVLSAFFITYSIFHICLFFFQKDRSMFLESENQEK
ncbi:MAG: phosphatase PAP2-related protein [Candidatus Paceibacterota bacterium]